MLLSDGYLANGAEPWLLPDVDSLPDISVPFATEPNHTDGDGKPEFWPYLRDPETLARPWAVPGTPGLDAPHRRHREGGRHRQHLLRPGQPRAHGPAAGRAKVAGIADDIPPVEVDGDVDDAEILVIGWGSTWGAIERCRRPGPRRAATASPRPTSPTSTRSRRTWARCCGAIPKVLVPEMNLGQLSPLLRGPSSWSTPRASPRCKGLPFTAGELERAILAELEKD